MAKYFGSKILTPGAKRKDVKILNFLWQNTLDQKFSHVAVSGEEQIACAADGENLFSRKDQTTGHLL